MGRRINGDDPARSLLLLKAVKTVPHKGDKRYQRRNEDGTFGEADNVSRSLSQDARQHAGYLRTIEQVDDQWRRKRTDLCAERLQTIFGAVDQDHLGASGGKGARAFEADA